MIHPNANQIEAELRRDFRARAREYGQTEDRNDPMVSLLFRTFADQIAGLYNGLDSAQLALLDELIGALEMEPRTARSAQAVVRFRAARPTALEPGLALTGEADSGERLTFLTDSGLTVSSARIAAGFTYQDEAVQLLSGIDLPEDIAALRLNFTPVGASLGMQPAIFLALDSLPASHLGMQSFFFDLNPRCERLHRSLANATWCIAGDTGDFGATGLLRSRKGSAGVRMLRWLVPPAEDGEDGNGTPESPGLALPDGFYAGRIFRFPAVPVDRRGVTGAPASIGPALERIFGNASKLFFSTPRAWLRIAMAPGVENLQASINTISANTCSCSNLSILNETIEFKRHGLSIPVSSEAGGKGFFVAVRSVSDERNREYLPLFEPGANGSLGRYSLRGGTLTLRPALDASGQPEGRAAVRLWVTNGDAGNRVSSNRIASLANPHTAPGLQVTSLTSAAGGTNNEGLIEVRKRFALALLSRDRIVTEADLILAAQAFDQRIDGVSVAPMVEPGETGLKTGHRVRLQMARENFAAEEEARVLIDDLREFLQDRSAAGINVSVEASWA